MVDILSVPYKPELIEEMEHAGISEECLHPGEGDGHSMCSEHPDCYCDCHKPRKGDITFHRCTNKSCRSTAVNPFCLFQEEVCVWEGATCSTCGEGKYKHDKQ